MHFYNDNDPHCCRWLGELAKAGHLPAGTIDNRSISDIQPHELTPYSQCHFFAGIGGWPLALKLAGWPAEQPVWTGSCPCQPFSCAGKGAGERDPRHLWPEFKRLIAECRPPVVFGEQVAGKAGKTWMCGVRDDLEDLGYAVGIARLPAAAVGTKHLRYRFFFVAHTMRPRLEGLHETRRRVDLQPAGSDVSRHNWQAAPRVLTRANGFSRKLDKPPAYREQVQAYGNAIVPQLAAEFIAAFVEAIADVQL